MNFKANKMFNVKNKEMNKYRQTNDLNCSQIETIISDLKQTETEPSPDKTYCIQTLFLFINIHVPFNTKLLNFKKCQDHIIISLSSFYTVNYVTETL